MIAIVVIQVDTIGFINGTCDCDEWCQQVSSGLSY